MSWHRVLGAVEENNFEIGLGTGAMMHTHTHTHTLYLARVI